MATLSAHKTVAAPFANTSEIVRVIYDFALDGGIATAKDVLTASGALVIKHFHLKVLTACVGATATLDVGISGGTTTYFANGIAVASLGAGTIHYPAQNVTIVLGEGTPNTVTSATMANPIPYTLADAGKIVMETNTAAFTAGKIELVFEVCRP